MEHDCKRRVEIVTWTRDMAQDFLRSSHAVVGTENETRQMRRVSEHKVREYRDAMLAGKWDVDRGEPIMIAKSRYVGNGQHRLEAVVEAAVPIAMRTIFNCTIEDIRTADSGRARTAVDAARIDGVQCAKEAAAALKWIVATETGAVYSSVNSIKFVNSEITKQIQEREGLQEAACYARALWDRSDKVLPCTILTVLVYGLRRISDPAKVEDFFERIMLGVDVEQGSTLAVLRAQLRGAKGGKKLESLRRRMEWTVRGWRAWCDGEDLSKMQVATSKHFVIPGIRDELK